jgi:geranylgeranyl pyrophosphate synthase
MNSKKSKKQSQRVIEELTKRSRKGLEFAKKTILAEKIESSKAGEALVHYVSNWNDFVHPGLFSMAYEAAGGDRDGAVHVQAALAMLAAALDLHDDIIDDSKSKHGTPTVFGKFGKDIAILLGDGLLIEGFNLLNKSIARLPQEKKKEILETLKESLFEVGNGHALELRLKGRIDIAPDEWIPILEMKAASFAADMHIGAVIGGGTTKEIEALTRYGKILGKLATLREEFVDVFDIEELNQRVSGEYLPIPVLYAMQSETVKRKVQKMFADGRIEESDVDELVTVVFQAKDVAKLKKRMNDLVKESTQIVSKLPNWKLKPQLNSLTSTFLEDL